MVHSFVRYSLFEAKEKGKAVGEDIGYDAHGEPTTDPGSILYGGAIRTFDRCAPCPSFLSRWGYGSVQCKQDLGSMDLMHNSSCFVCDTL